MAALVGSRPIEVEAPVRSPRTPVGSDPAVWARFFEDVYQSAEGDASRIPWADGRANPALVAWLNAEAPSLLRPGASVAVVGCGLGDDVAELAGRGYDALGFDVSPTAIDWARRQHPELGDHLIVADLLDLPARMMRRFDLVVEIYTLQALHPSLRQDAAAAVCSLARPRGSVLAVCRGRDRSEALESVQGPPYPLTPAELLVLMGSQGFAPARPVDDFMDDQTPPQRRLRGLFRRA